MRAIRKRRLVSSYGGGAAFTPASISGLKLWLDASQITGLNDGDAVGTWSDLSGQGNNVTQGTASKKPTYQTNEQNGRPVVQFDGVDDTLTNASVAFPASEGSLFAIAKLVSLGSYPLILAYGSLAAAGKWYSGYSSSSGRFMKCLGSSNSGAGQVAAGPTGSSVNSVGRGFLLQEATLSTGGVWTSFEKGVQKDQNTFSFTPNATDVLWVGSRNETVLMDGSMGEVLYYNKEVSSGERAAIEAYLIAKWAV